MELIYIEPNILKLSHNGVTEVIKDFKFGTFLWDSLKEKGQKVIDGNRIPGSLYLSTMYPDYSDLLIRCLLYNAYEYPEALRLITVLLPVVIQDQATKPFMRCTWKDCLSKATELQTATDGAVFANLCHTHVDFLNAATSSGDAGKLVRAWILCQGGSEKAAARMSATSPFTKH